MLRCMAVVKDANSTAASHGEAISFASSTCRGTSIKASSSSIDDQSLSRASVVFINLAHYYGKRDRARWSLAISLAH